MHKALGNSILGCRLRRNRPSAAPNRLQQASPSDSVRMRVVSFSPAALLHIRLAEHQQHAPRQNPKPAQRYPTLGNFLMLRGRKVESQARRYKFPAARRLSPGAGAAHPLGDPDNPNPSFSPSPAMTRDWVNVAHKQL